MTIEHKKLLLKDLCARLPYGVKCKLIYNNKAIKDEDATLFAVDKYGHFLFAEFGEDIREFVCKPYLFPLSSMTEEQCYKLASIRSGFQDCWKYIKTPIPLSIFNFEQIDWFNKNYFDYRGLIPMGLAIDATNLNIY